MAVKRRHTWADVAWIASKKARKFYKGAKAVKPHTMSLKKTEVYQNQKPENEPVLENLPEKVRLVSEHSSE